MAIVTKLEAVADAIRSRTGKTDKMTLAQMPGEIEGIPSGGGAIKFATATTTIVPPVVAPTVECMDMTISYADATVSVG